MQRSACQLRMCSLVCLTGYAVVGSARARNALHFGRWYVCTPFYVATPSCAWGSLVVPWREWRGQTGRVGDGAGRGEVEWNGMETKTGMAMDYSTELITMSWTEMIGNELAPDANRNGVQRNCIERNGFGH